MIFQREFADGKIRASCRDDIGSLVIDNPERKNAVSSAMWRAIPAALDWLVADAAARVVIITGAGDHDFSAGADISEFAIVRKDAATARIYEKENSDAFTAIRRCRVPTIASIRDICYGGGFGIAAACDLRLSDDSARFSVPPARLGLAYPADAVQDILFSLGPQMAKKALFTGAIMLPSELLAAGFLLEIAPSAELAEKVHTLAGTIATNAPLSVTASKLALRAAAEGNEVLRAEAEKAGAVTFESHDYAEGRRAFAERRKPAFTGR